MDAGAIVARAIERALVEAQSEMRSRIVPGSVRWDLTQPPDRMALTVRVQVDIDPREI